MILKAPAGIAARLCIAAGIAAALLPACAHADQLVTAAARKLLLAGKYAEAEDAYLALAEKEAVDAALGLARCRSAVGNMDGAAEALLAAAKAHADAAQLPGGLALVCLQQGKLDQAGEQAAAALKLDPNNVAGRWVQAELNRLSGKLEEANKGYEWFIEFHNREDVQDADDLRLIGLASAQFARWNRLSDQFQFLVNEFYPSLLEREPGYWPAHYEAGRLFLEKYNQADASKEFKAALALNPNSAELKVALGELALQGFELDQVQAAAREALELNPKLLAAHELQADVHLANIDAQQAADVLERALKLDPAAPTVLGRLAVSYAVLDGKLDAGSRFGRTVAKANQANPRPGEFFLTVADAFDRVRRFPLAAEYYEKAIEAMPQLAAARGQLGMMLMRLGEEKRAKEVLSESFEVDPFNVRVSNSLKVLEVLDGYETLETAHFIIKFDGKKDRVLAGYAARWLEEVYPRLCKQFDFEPPQKSLFEIFNSTKNTDGHGWFSARMVGLPHVHTIGACAGKIVAMQSPTDGKQRFNWARVLKHEFVHVINLQQTNFNIPHWYTEALAVLNEGYPRPEEWDKLLCERVPADKLFDLDSINLGFIRPHSSVDWNLAYCQAELYAQYMLERHGEQALAKMLAAYADNLSTRDALKRSFGVEQEDFEKGYREYLSKIVAGLSSSKSEKPDTLATLQKKLAAEPKNPDLLSQVALAHLNRKAYPEARRLAEQALAIEPKQQLAAYVKARLHLLIGENDKALAVLEGSLDKVAPQENLLGLLAGLRFKAEDYAAAASLYELGAQRDPTNTKWTKSLASVYLKSGDKERLTAILQKLAESEADDLPVRKKLAELMLAAKDYKAAAAWSRQALQIDVLDVDLHRIAAEALLAGGDTPGAILEYGVGIELKPDFSALRFGLAQAYVDAKQPADARKALNDLLARDPDYPGAELMLEGLAP